ncbi:MAG TPA: type VI secretion system baseplate subunit TssG [Pseudomonadota bacterium]|nr:type VI secretion system baseplate subunit TssG [Pseudomonadota bacterium]
MSGADSVAGYQLFSLLRLLESQAPQAAALGESGPASAEAVRLRPSLELSFPTSEAVAVEHRQSVDGAPRSVVTANISGLYGVGSPLPRSYPHQVLLQADTDPQQRDFLDIIHHRVLSLWYRSFRRQHYEQSFAEDGTDLLSQALLDWLGVPRGATEDQLGTSPLRLLRYLGLFAASTRTAAGLEVLLREELHQPIVVEPASLRWVRLPKSQWPTLSRNPKQRAALGRDLVIGSRHLDRQCSLTLHMGPVSYETLLAFWPGETLHTRLHALASFYLRQPLALTLRVSVPKSELARQRLGRQSGGMLGRPAAMGEPQTDPVVLVIPDRENRGCTESA